MLEKTFVVRKHQSLVLDSDSACRTFMLLILLLGLMSTGCSSAFAESKYTFSSDWVSRRTAHWEEILAPFKNKPGISAIEVGCFEGRSVIWFLENIVTHPDSNITCIDPFFEQYHGRSYEDIYKSNIANGNFGTRIQTIKGFSNVELRKLPQEKYDFIYIDGCHKARCVIEDAIFSWQLLKIGGTLIFDDYDINLRRYGIMGRPKFAIDTFFEMYRAEIEVIRYGPGQVFFRKLKDNSRK